MNPNLPIVLKGKNAELFEKYQKTKGTKKEIDFMKRSEEFYLKHCQNQPKNSSKQ